jgi:hypothetical protein
MSRLPVDADTDPRVHGPVRDLPVADLDHDRVDEHHRIHVIERAGLPLRHVPEDPVSDLRDRLTTELGRVHLRQMRFDLTGGESFRGERDHHRVDTIEPALTLRTVNGSKLPSRSRGTSISTGPISVITVFERVPLRLLPWLRPSAACFA